MNPLSPRVANLNFSTPCGTAYSAKDLAALPANKELEQFTEDRAALNSLSQDFEDHDKAFWTGDSARFRALAGMAASMGENLAWTGRQFFSVTRPKIPDCLVIGSEESQYEVQQDSEQQQGDNGCCSNPFEGDDFSENHRALHTAMNSVRASLTPEKNADESFNVYYKAKDWGTRWSDFSAKYHGSATRVGEYQEDRREIQLSWNSIKFDQGWLAPVEYWEPGCDDFSSPLPWGEAYKKGWDSFKSCCSEIWNSTCLQAEIPSWSCELLDEARAGLATAVKGPIPFFTECSRPKMEDLISEPGKSSCPIYDNCLHSFIRGFKTVARSILWAVSPVAWVVKFLVKNILCNIFIGAANVLYKFGAGILWAATWPAQLVALFGKTLWQASKFLLLNPLAKFVGLSGATLAYGIAAGLYAVSAVAAWTVKAILQCVRFVVQNVAIGLCNVLGRRFAWVAAHAAVAVKQMGLIVWTGIKEFLHGVYTLGANACSYLGGKIYYHLVRPFGEWSAKSVLAVAQLFGGHLSIVAGQVVYVVCKAVWHFVLHPAYKAVSWAAGKFGQCLKFVWNKIALPALYYLAWTPVKFVLEKVGLFVAAVVQLPVYGFILLLGGTGVGIWFGVSEFSLFLQSHWISKAIYPLPIAAIYRSVEAPALGAVARPPVPSDFATT